VTDGRDVSGRFVAGPSPDRGRGPRRARDRLLLDGDLHRIVMATANLPVSIPRGRGRCVVTLYEAQIRRLATGKVYRRAAVMDFIRLVQRVASSAPEPVAVIPAPGITRLEDCLATLRATAASADATQLDKSAVTFYELLLDVLRARSQT
jgi:hypothetical protein